MGLLGKALYALAAPLIVPVVLSIYVSFFVAKPKEVSTTAFAVFLRRLTLTLSKQRSDEAAKKLAAALKFAPVQTLHAVLKVMESIEKIDEVGLLPTAATGDLVAIRTKKIDRERENFVDASGSNMQLLIVGAGFDTNSYQPEVVAAAKHETKNLRAFELDKQSTQTVKVKGVEDAELEKGHVAFISCELGKDDWIQCLKNEGFQTGNPTLALWEGVTYYLTKDDVGKTLQEFASIMTPNDRLVFDFPFLRAASEAFLKRLESFGEPWKFDLDSKPSLNSCTVAISEFLASNGFRVVDLTFFEKPARGFGAFSGGVVVCVPLQ